MGFLSNIFGSGATRSIRNAQQTAEQQRMAGMNQAMGFLDQGADKAANLVGQNRPIYDTAYGNAKGALNSGYNAAISGLGGINEYLSPYNTTGNQANSAWADAMGLNGAEGSARASQAFRATPGIQSAINAGEDSLLRKASVTGGLASGNTLRALQDAAIDTTNNYYGQYMDRLSGGQNMGLQAAFGMGQNDLSKANLQADQGNALAGLEMNNANNLAGINNAQAGIYNGLGDNKAGLVQGTYNQLANDGISAGNAISQARNNQASNIMTAISSGINSIWGRR